MPGDAESSGASGFRVLCGSCAVLLVLRLHDAGRFNATLSVSHLEASLGHAGLKIGDFEQVRPGEPSCMRGSPLESMLEACQHSEIDTGCVSVL